MHNRFHRSAFRNRFRFALPCALIFAAACAAPPFEPAESAGTPTFSVLSPELVSTASALRDRALEDERAWSFLEGLSVEVGPRSAGSAGDHRAVVWARTTLQAWQLAKVRAEAVTVPHWDRGNESGRIVSPFPQKLVLTALGGSVGTPEGGLEADVLRVESLAAVGALDAGDAEGKVVFIDERMERTKTGDGYRTAVAKRVAGASAAAEKGAVGLLIRSAGTSTTRIAHTGTMRYRDGVPRIPAAALSNTDADLLGAQVRRGGPVRVHIELGARDLGEAESANVIAEVVGRELPEEVIVLAAHLDSWDLGTGTIDDGAGCAIMAAAARLIADLPQPPRRTIRVLLAANEEHGLSGAKAYGERYGDAMAQHVAGLESDFGAARVWSLRSRVAEDQLPLVDDLAKLLAPLGIELGGNEAEGGADLRPLRAAGVPVFDLAQDGSDYFDIHHTIDDTLDKVDPASLRQNVAAYATLAYVLAEQPGELGRVLVPEPQDGP